MFKKLFVLLAIPVLLAGSMQAQADPVGGTQTAYTNVLAHRTDVYRLECWGGQQTQVNVVGDGDTNLMVLVYDDAGNLIVTDTGVSATVTFTVFRTGTFTIKVINLGDVYNHYFIKVW